MTIRESALTDEILSKLIDLSREWEAENSCFGYRANGREDIEGNRIFVAEENGEIIAYLFGYPFQSKNMKSIMPEGSSCFEVEEIYVKPALRSRGIGKALFEFAEKAVHGDTDYMVLSTATKNWKAVFHFYLEELGMTFWSARLFKEISKDDHSCCKADSRGGPQEPEFPDSGIRLVPMTPEMFHGYFREFENDPDLCPDPAAYVPCVCTEEKADQYIRRQSDLNRINLAIVLRDDIIGEVVIKNIAEHQYATLGITLKNSRYKGHGFGTRAVKLATAYVFYELDIPVLYADVLQTNTRSRHVLEKSGFRFVREDRDFRYYRIDRDLPGGGADALAQLFVERSRMILGDNLDGIYLHGSAAMGCWNPAKSDLDLIVVVRDSPDDACKRTFMEMVTELSTLLPGKEAAHSGIEMSVVLRNVCDPFVYPTPFELHFSAGHLEWYRRDPEDYILNMKGTDKDLAAHFTVIRRRGKCLYGLPAEKVFGEVPPEDYLDSILTDIAGAREEIAGNTMYLVLNLARVLAYRKDGAVLSKKEGGEWGLLHLPEKYHPLIQAALEDYGSDTVLSYDPDLAREYADYMLDRTDERDENQHGAV